MLFRVQSIVFGLRHWLDNKEIGHALTEGMPDWFEPRIPKAVRLEPPFLVLYVGPDKLLVRLGEIDNSFDDPDYPAHAAGYQSDYDLDNPFVGVTQDKFMNSPSAQQNSTDPAVSFLSAPSAFQSVIAPDPP